jgi:hypothetical protein
MVYPSPIGLISEGRAWGVTVRPPASSACDAKAFVRGIRVADDWHGRFLSVPEAVWRHESTQGNTYDLYATRVPLAPQGFMVSCSAPAQHTRDDDRGWTDEPLGVGPVVTDSIRLPVWTEQMAEDHQLKANISPEKLRIFVAPTMDCSHANSRPNT